VEATGVEVSEFDLIDVFDLRNPLSEFFLFVDVSDLSTKLFFP